MKRKKKVTILRSRWIEQNRNKVLYQYFANPFHNTQAVKLELVAVQESVFKEPANFLLVVSDLTKRMPIIVFAG